MWPCDTLRAGVTPPRIITHFIPVRFLVRDISSQSKINTSLTAAWALSSVNPQPWRFTNNSLGLPHAHSLSICLLLWVCVVCVCFILYLSSYLCCARCVFCVLFYIHNLPFVCILLFPANPIDTYVLVPIDVHIALPICLSSSSVCIPICLIHAYVYVNLYKHFPPLPHSYTPIALSESICIYVTIIVSWPLINMNIPIVIRLCVPASRGFARCLHTCDPMFKGLYFSIHTCLYCFLWIHTHHVHIKTCLIVYAPPLSICALFNYVFIRVYYIHLNTCSCMNVYTKTVQNK